MLSLEHLNIEHLDAFRRALFNILYSSVGEFTFAQLVDGQPIRAVYVRDHWGTDTDGLPVMEHETLCPGSIEKTQAIRSASHGSSMILRKPLANTK